MTRMARVVIPNVPHHVTQRGVRSMPIFETENDYRVYLKLLREHCLEHELHILAYCLMPNHVHFLAVPGSIESLAKGIGNTHREYTIYFNSKEDVKGHLFQERFFSCPLDIKHTFATFRYILQNPVKAGIVEHIEDYDWSSAKYNLGVTDSNSIVNSELLSEYIGDPDGLLVATSIVDEDTIKFIQERTRTGRPCGNRGFTAQLESVTGRKLAKITPGPKSRSN